MTNYLWIGVIALGGTLTTQAATFELLGSQASVGIGAWKTQANRISNFEIGENFTSYSDTAGRDPFGIATQVTDIDSAAGSITSVASSTLGGGYNGQSTTSLDVSFQVFEATSYSFDTADFSRKATLNFSGAGGSILSKSLNNDLSGQLSGVLAPGTYSLSAGNLAAASGVNPNSTVGRSSSYALGLSLGGSAGVPEATQSACFLAGSLMFLLASTRRRGAIG